MAGAGATSEAPKGREISQLQYQVGELVIGCWRLGAGGLAGALGRRLRRR